MHDENSDFKNFLLYGILGKLTPGIQFTRIIELLGEPESTGDSYSQFTSLTYDNLVLYIINDALHFFEIYFDRCSDNKDEMLKYPGISWYNQICGSNLRDIKNFLENNNIIGRRIVFNIDIPEVGLEQYWEIYPSKIRLWFDEDGCITRMVFDPEGSGNVTYTDI